MKISEGIVKEAMKKVEEAKSALEEYLAKTFLQIQEENPHLANFMNRVVETWEEDPPQTLDGQLKRLSADLVIIVDMFRRQEEVDKLEEQWKKSE